MHCENLDLLFNKVDIYLLQEKTDFFLFVCRFLGIVNIEVIFLPSTSFKPVGSKTLARYTVHVYRRITFCKHDIFRWQTYMMELAGIDII